MAWLHPQGFWFVWTGMGSRHWSRFAKPPGHTDEQLGLRATCLDARATEDGGATKLPFQGERRDVPSSLTNAQMSLTEEEPRPRLVPALGRPRLDLQGPATAWAG